MYLFENHGVVRGFSPQKTQKGTKNMLQSSSQKEIKRAKEHKSLFGTLLGAQP
jgi:hypothetical protein